MISRIDVLREQTQGLSLREIIELVLEHSELMTHYKAEREGSERIEHLEDQANAVERLFKPAGLGHRPVALPIDELATPPAAATVDACHRGFFENYSGCTRRKLCVVGMANKNACDIGNQILHGETQAD